MIYPDKGYIGCFEMADFNSGKRRLKEYVAQLINAGAKKIIAPINGSTWRTYRLVSRSNGRAPFPLEPQNPAWYNDVYLECGFLPLKKYGSDVFSTENVAPLPADDASPRLREFRDGDLKIIYDISIRSFNENFLYDGISFGEFRALYEPLLRTADKELITVAEVAGSPAGFVFAFASKGDLIIKTVATLPEFRNLGLASMMINRALLTGRRKNLKTAVAALMADDNNSRKIVSKYGSETFREYTLYCLEVKL